MKKTTAEKINNIKKINEKNYDRKLCISYNKSHFLIEVSSTEDSNISQIVFQDESVLEFNVRKQTTKVI